MGLSNQGFRAMFLKSKIDLRLKTKLGNQGFQLKIGVSKAAIQKKHFLGFAAGYNFNVRHF